MILLVFLTGCEQSPARKPSDAKEVKPEQPPWADPVDRKEEANLGGGRWRVFREESAESVLTDEQRETIEKLEAIGYVGGSQEAKGKSGVTVLERDRVYSGLNFYTSGHSPEATLMDIEGTVLHTWSSDFWEVFPEFATSRDNENTQFWRRAHLFETGEVLAIFEGLGLVKLDKDSNVIWANPCRAHHDLEVMPSGEVYALTREARLIPRLSTGPILEDSISVLSPEGEVKKQVSLVECFENSERYGHIMLSREPLIGDILHTNTVHVLDGRIADRDPAFEQGNVLISSATMDTIAVVDLDQRKVVWAYQGSFAKQHDPRILENGNLLLFNNLGIEGRSTVMEFDPVTKEMKWEYDPSPDGSFYSRTCSTAERLPNGNTLITESDNGRAVEVTRDKEIVWEFHNPHRAGEDAKYIATLFEVVRLGPAFPTDWID
jgi:hypothetical protein